MNDTITKIQIKDCTLYHADCIDVFDEIGKVDVVITDPPYGSDADFYRKNAILKNSKAIYSRKYEHGWNKKLPITYIEKILSLSHDQIIFGGNYYANWLPPSVCWLVWDKKTRTKLSDCELIYTSYKTAVRKIAYLWEGWWQEDMKNKEKRYHPTQKPLYVMRWIIDKYTKETDLILDPFMGSGSTGVAAAIGGRKFIGIEKEKQYFDIACKRIRWACKQNALF